MGLKVQGKKLLIVEMVETQNMIRDRDIGARSRLMEMELNQRLGIAVHLLVLGIHAIIWMMMHQLMVQDKKELLVTIQDKSILGGQVLSIMGIPFLAENPQTRISWMGRLKVAGNKAEGLAKTSKKHADTTKVGPHDS